MDIHIHHFGRQRHMEDTAGELALHHLIFIGFLQRRRQKLGLHKAPVDEQHLLAAAAVTVKGLGDEAAHLHIAAAPFNRQQGQGKIAPHGGVNGGIELPVTGSVECFLPVADELEGDMGMAQRQMLHHTGDGGALSAVLFHELHAGGRVIEEVADADGSALRRTCLRHILRCAALNVERAARRTALGAGENVHAADGGNGSQRLTAKAQCADGAQIIGSAELTGGVAQKGRGQLVMGDAAAVVADADIGHAAVLNLHHNGRASGVNGVFHQLLHHTGGTLHHLACGNQVRHMGRQTLDMRHKLLLTAISASIHTAGSALPRGTGCPPAYGAARQ